MATYRPQVKLIHYAKDSTGQGWESTYTDLTTYLSTNGTIDIKVQADKFNLEFYTEDSTLPSLIGIDDRIQIFASMDNYFEIDPTDSSHFDSYNICDVVVNSTTWEETDRGNIFRIEAISASEKLLRTLVPISAVQSQTYPSASDKIQFILSLANEYNNVKVYWHPDNDVTTQSTDYFSEMGPAYEHIMKLSTPEHTGGNYYYFYIRTESDGKNYLIWKKRELGAVTGDLIDGQHIMNLKIEKGIWDTVNFVIADCGVDPAGHKIRTYVYDADGMATVGMRAAYHAENYEAFIMKMEQTGNPSSFPDDRNKSYPSSYPYTTYLTGETINNDEEWIDYIRRTTKNLAKLELRTMLERMGKATYKAECETIVGTKEYVLGSIYRITSEKYGWVQSGSTDNRQHMRLAEINHNIDNTGWNTKLKFEQDWEVAGVI